jgi:homoserine kinase type II
VDAQQSDLDPVLKQWLPHNSWSINPGLSGMNNTTCYIEADGVTYVLRIYETHRDEAKVRYEHAVLQALAKLVLPFKTPSPVRTSRGETYLRLGAEGEEGAGKLAALFHYIVGDRPDMDTIGQIHSFGEATAMLAEALNQIKLTLDPVYPAYYQLGLDDSHSMLQAISFCRQPYAPFVEMTEELERVGQLLDTFVSQAPALRKLPHQLIHGDLNASNILAEADRIAAILDFEFVTMDLRVMELAVCLSDMIQPEIDSVQTGWDKIEAYASGYGRATKLTGDEIAALPMLIQLRRLDVFVHFLGRYEEGIDPPEIVVKMIASAISMDKWLKAQQEHLVSLCQQYLL